MLGICECVKTARQFLQAKAQLAIGSIPLAFNQAGQFSDYM